MAPMKKSSWSVPLVQVLCLFTSIVALVFIAPQSQPSLHAFLVKLLPCLSLLLYVWTAQTSNHNEEAALTSSRGTFLYLLGFEAKLAGNIPKGKNISVTNEKVSSGTNFVLQRQLVVGTARGLLFSVFGDGIMVWHEQEAYFIMGMLAFAVAQVCYIQGLGFGRVRVASGVLIYGALTGVSVALLADASRLFQVLVPCYAALLATMLWRAVDRCGVEDGRPLWQRRFMVLGALVFVLSDSCIALFKFVLTTRAVIAQGVILSTYFLAQTLLVFGAVAQP